MEYVMQVLAAVAAGLLGLIFTIRLLVGPRPVRRWERIVLAVLVTILFAGLWINSVGASHGRVLRNSRVPAGR